MEEWKSYKLGDISTIQTGPFGSQLHQSDYVESGVPCIMPTNIGRMLDFQVAGIAHISEGDALRLSRHIVHEGDIVYSRRGDIEKCAYVSQEQDGWFCGTGCLKITINSNLAVPKFVAYYLSTDEIKSWIVGNAVGTTMLNLNTSVLADVPLSLPSIQMQKRCVQILDSIENKIALNNRINHNLEEQAKALYKSWFVDFEPFKDCEFIDSELGLIPSGWHVGTISELISDTFNGDWGKDESTGVFTKRVFCIRGADIPSIRVGNSGKMPIRYIQEKHFMSKYLKNDDLVIEISGGSPTQSTGRFCRITDDLIERYDHSLVCTNFCKAIRPTEGCSLFLSYLWNELYEKGTMFSFENGTTGIKNLDLSGLIEGEPVIIPDKHSIQLFSITVSALNEQIVFNGHENEKLGEQRDLMLPKLMSGELLSNNIDC